MKSNRSMRIGSITPVLADGDLRLSTDETFIWHAPFAVLKCHIQELYLQEARQQEKEQLFNQKEKQIKNKEATLRSKTWITRGKKPCGKKLPPADSFLMI